MRFCGPLALAALLTLAACGERELRCDYHLQPINTPRSKAAAWTGSPAELSTTSETKIAPAARGHEAAAAPTLVTP